jgi:hypothetical protein
MDPAPSRSAKHARVQVESEENRAVATGNALYEDFEDDDEHARWQMSSPQSHLDLDQPTVTDTSHTTDDDHEHHGIQESTSVGFHTPRTSRSYQPVSTQSHYSPPPKDTQARPSPPPPSDAYPRRATVAAATNHATGTASTTTSSSSSSSRNSSAALLRHTASLWCIAAALTVIALTLMAQFIAHQVCDDRSSSRSACGQSSPSEPSSSSSLHNRNVQPPPTIMASPSLAPARNIFGPPTGLVIATLPPRVPPRTSAAPTTVPRTSAPTMVQTTLVPTATGTTTTALPTAPPVLDIIQAPLVPPTATTTLVPTVNEGTMSVVPTTTPDFPTVVLSVPTTRAPRAQSPVPPGTVIPTIAPRSRAQEITAFVNAITLTNRTIALPKTAAAARPGSELPAANAEDLALQWLIRDDPLQLRPDSDAQKFRLTQRYALLTLWFQPRPQNEAWLIDTDWLSANECQWYGLGCADTDLNGNIGRQAEVTVIILDDNNVGGTLSSDLGLLTHLETFSVTNHGLVGTVPAALGRWTRLTYWSVQNGQLTGTIPLSVANWTNIANAFWNLNNFTGTVPRGLCQSTALTYHFADCPEEVICTCCTNCL